MDWKCGWGGSAPRSVFDEGGVKAGCLAVVVGGPDPQRAGPQPDVLLVRITPLAPGRVARCRGAGNEVTDADGLRQLAPSHEAGTAALEEHGLYVGLGELLCNLRPQFAHVAE